MYVHTHVPLIDIHVHVLTYIHTLVPTLIHVCTCTYPSVYIPLYVHTLICSYPYMFIPLYVHVLGIRSCCGRERRSWQRR